MWFKINHSYVEISEKRIEIHRWNATLFES